MKRTSWNFADELSRWGPRAGGVSTRSDATAISLHAAQAYCRHVAQAHYENFTVASWLLPRRSRAHFHAVYAYCRWADDLADEASADAASSMLAEGSTTGQLAFRLHSAASTITAAPAVEFTANSRLKLLDWWEEQLLDCYRGVPARHPVMVALGATIREFEIPAQPFRDLLVAFRQDQFVSRYESFDELLGYCRNSANPVGRLVLYLARAHNADNVELSDSICTGLQLANFWQDLAVDWRRGRCYVPLEGLHAHGIDQGELETGRATPALRQVLAAEVERAERWLRAGFPLVGRVPGWLRVDLELFIGGGLAILDSIRRAEYDVWTARPTVSRLTKMRLLAGALTRRLLGRLPVGEARR